MAFRVQLTERPKPMGALVADRPLCLTADREKIVEAGDVQSAFVLASRAGKEIPATEVERLGLVLVDGKIQQKVAAQEPAPETAAEDEPKPRRKKSDRE